MAGPRHHTKAMFHSTAMVPDYDQSVARLAALVGLRVLEYGEQPEPEVGRRGGMTWIGDGSLEIGQPIAPGAPPDRFVQRTGGGMQGVALWVEDLAATARHLEANASAMPVRLPQGFGFSSPRTTCGIQLEWSELSVPEDPRRGATLPPLERAPLLDVTHHAFVGALVDEPLEAAHRLAALTGTETTFARADAPPGEPAAGVSLGDCTLALYRLASEASEELWGRRHDRPRVSLLGVCVPDLGAARAALADAGVRVLRETPGTLVLDPAATGDVELAVDEALLPGDPRA